MNLILSIPIERKGIRQQVTVKFVLVDAIWCLLSNLQILDLNLITQIVSSISTLHMPRRMDRKYLCYLRLGMKLLILR